MAKTRSKFIPGITDKQKFYAAIFRTGNAPLDISLSVGCMTNHMNNISITIVYWDSGKKKIIKDYIAGGASTAISFTINNPTSIPPFILYLDSDGPTTVDIEIDFTFALTVEAWSAFDDILMLPDDLSTPTSSLYDVIITNRVPTKIAKIKTLFSEGSEVRSPLVIDLDGDGVETVSAENGVYFDHDGNGFKENSGWASADDGILGIGLDYDNQEVIDANGNKHLQVGTTTESVKSSGTIEDIWFETNPENVVYNELQIEIPEDMSSLPNVPGSGNVYDLKSAG